MKSEAEVRGWRLDLYKELVETGHIESTRTATVAAIDALGWVLGDTPQADLARIKALVAAKIGEGPAHGWLTESLLGEGITPLKAIAAGRADFLLPIIDRLTA